MKRELGEDWGVCVFVPLWQCLRTVQSFCSDSLANALLLFCLLLAEARPPEAKAQRLLKWRAKKKQRWNNRAINTAKEHSAVTKLMNDTLHCQADFPDNILSKEINPWRKTIVKKTCIYPSTMYIFTLYYYTIITLLQNYCECVKNNIRYFNYP